VIARCIRRHYEGDVTCVASETGTAMGAERDRVTAFGKLEDGLRQAGDWYR